MPTEPQIIKVTDEAAVIEKLSALIEAKAKVSFPPKPWFIPKNLLKNPVWQAIKLILDFLLNEHYFWFSQKAK
jgi:hypothetical protein